MTDASRQAASDWWRTEIIDIEPGVIRMRGYPIEQLIGNIDFPQMIWLLLRGDLPSKEEAALLGHMLVAGVDHGPHAPSIAIARIAATCGVGINNAVASAANVLGDVHGGAGEQTMEIMADIDARTGKGEALEDAVRAVLDDYQARVTKYVPGFGHRFHPRDPRGPRLLGLVEEAAAAGHVSGRFAKIGRAIEADLERRSGRHLTMNIDGSGAVVLSELGFAPVLGRGLFVLSRSVGILAHAWEQTQQGGRNKGPIPRDFPYTYAGHPPRDLKGATTR
ncbi:citryl-CoA lyase [Acuticoccus kandeliae]|uniref:citryl-CoA lyase n=1 Tax=Acuticoccus kandeliae TaxID=2073160 RepID=UPI000D3E3D0E|nr:citryl-CoA lyase [Acuticoccus kandeliae]